MHLGTKYKHDKADVHISIFYICNSNDIQE